MNIAFPALVVFLLLLPGVLLSYSYRRGFFQRSPVTLNPIREEISRGVVWALFIHPVALYVLGLFGKTPDATALLGLVLKQAPASLAVANEDHLLHWVAYLVGINLVALLVGAGAHTFVRRRYLDLRYDWLRFNNEWHYLFSGEARIFAIDQLERDFESIQAFIESDDLDFVFVSVVIEQGDGPILYWGTLSDFFFDANGVLESIVLEDAQRRRLNSEEDDVDSDAATPVNDDRFYPIRGNYLVIRYADVKTLNLEYLRIELPEEETGDGTESEDDQDGVGPPDGFAWAFSKS